MNEFKARALMEEKPGTIGSVTKASSKMTKAFPNPNEHE